MGSRLLCAALFLALYLGQCSCQSTVTVLEWTDTANANLTLFMSRVKFKAGDTLRFNNTDVKDHDVLELTSQADYDACNATGSGRTINAGESYEIVFPDPVYRVWIIDTVSCAVGQKVEFTVLNADGTAVLPDAGADPPSLNAPPTDPDAPPSPPAPPLSTTGGPSPNAAVLSQPSLLWSMLAALLAACYRF